MEKEESGTVYVPRDLFERMVSTLESYGFTSLDIEVARELLAADPVTEFNTSLADINDIYAQEYRSREIK